jgi:formate dehydrogenase subunit delta
MLRRRKDRGKRGTGGVTTGKIDRLVRMANQIGEFYATMPEQEATAGVVSHLRLYWTPKMIREIIAFADGGHPGLNAVASRAVRSLRETATPA